MKINQINQNEFNAGDLVYHSWFNKKNTFGMVVRESKDLGYYQVYWIKVSERAGDKREWMITYYENGFSKYVLRKY